MGKDPNNEHCGKRYSNEHYGEVKTTDTEERDTV